MLNKKKLMNIIEPVLFDEKELLSLKTLINNVGSNKVEPKILRNAIIENRISIMKRLTDTFFFQIKHEIEQQKIISFTETGAEPNTKHEEIIEFFEQSAERIQRIYDVASEKLGPIE